jgi:trigger factor
MAVTVETLEKLERKITLTLPVVAVESEVEKRLKKIARTVKMDGFRPGKVPMNVVAQRYGYSVHYEVMNDKVGEAFANAANEAKLRVAGQPRITEKEVSPEGELAFDAVFEVFPEVKIGDLSSVEVEKVTAEVNESAVDKTLDILRKQRRTFAQRAQDAAVQNGDRVTVDFEGKIDGEVFAGGKAEDFQFIVGDGQMLKEFEEATRGMKSGESKTFQLSFPADYHGKDVAGKTADFMVTLKKVEAASLPEVDEALAKSLGIIADATVEGLRADIKQEFAARSQVPLVGSQQTGSHGRVGVQGRTGPAHRQRAVEMERLIESARADLKQRGVKDADKAPFPRTSSALKPSVACVWAWWWLNWCVPTTCKPRPEQIKAHIEELAASYEKPAEVLRWYYSDNTRLAEVEGIVIENNVTDFVLGKAKVNEKSVSFDELMGSAKLKSIAAFPWAAAMGLVPGLQSWYTSPIFFETFIFRYSTVVRAINCEANKGFNKTRLQLIRKQT